MRYQPAGHLVAAAGTEGSHHEVCIRMSDLLGESSCFPPSCTPYFWLSDGLACRMAFLHINIRARGLVQPEPVGAWSSIERWLSRLMQFSLMSGPLTQSISSRSISSFGLLLELYSPPLQFSHLHQSPFCTFPPTTYAWVRVCVCEWGMGLLTSRTCLQSSNIPSKKLAGVVDT